MHLDHGPTYNGYKGPSLCWAMWSMTGEEDGQLVSK